MKKPVFWIFALLCCFCSLLSCTKNGNNSPAFQRIKSNLKKGAQIFFRKKKSSGNALFVPAATLQKSDTRSITGIDHQQLSQLPLKEAVVTAGKILKLKANPSVQDIESAYKSMALKMHPDKRLKASNDFMLIKEARNVMIFEKRFKQDVDGLETLLRQSSSKKSRKHIERIYSKVRDREKTERILARELLGGNPFSVKNIQNVNNLVDLWAKGDFDSAKKLIASSRKSNFLWYLKPWMD